MSSKSNLDLVAECDRWRLRIDDGLVTLADLLFRSFPYAESMGLESHTRYVNSLYKFYIKNSDRIYGYMLPEIVQKMPWTDEFEINHMTRRCVLLETDRFASSDALAKVLDAARKSETFGVLKGWRNELYPLMGHGSGLRIERAGSALFGILTLGVHMTAYVRTEQGMKIWIPRRAKTKQTYGGMLDNTVAGGISAGELPLPCLVREAAEEASLPVGVVYKGVRACGTVSYFHIRDERAGGETGLMQPETQYVYDLELPVDVITKPNDDEVEQFFLMTIEEVQMALSKGEFKPNCALVMIDFFVRYGILTAENEPDYLELVSRMHRTLPFPTTVRKA